MDLLNGNIRPVYFRYLAASFGSVLITSIYGLVDMAMVGQYHGPNGTAALAVVAPIWNLMFSLGLLTGIGGAVLYSSARGSGQSTHELNEYFTASVICTAAVSLLCWAAVLLFQRPLLLFFGADEVLLPLAERYMKTVKLVIPFFMFSQMLSAFLRNDNDPGRATAAVLSGGIFNIFGDWFFVFHLDMGVFGAGLATAIGSLITIVVTLSHFFSRKNTLRLVRPSGFWHRLRLISVNGFSSFFLDVAMGILTIMFNRQIMKHLGGDALAVYGVIINVSTIVQCCAYSVGQSAQPIMSVNYGAGKSERILETLKYALMASAFFGLVWTAVTLAVPNGFIRIFMQPTDSVLAIAPGIIRRYALSFLLLPLNIFSTYYFQSIMKPGYSMTVSVLRGIALSGALIFILPTLLPASSIWFAMPITELVTAVLSVFLICRCSARLHTN